MFARTRTLCLCLAVAALHACAPRSAQTPVRGTGVAPEPQAATTLVYRCPDGTAFDVRLEGELAWLALADETLVLRRQASASGARYGDGRWVYWSTGEKALLEGPGTAHPDCRIAR